MCNTARQKCGFCEGKMFRKRHKKVSWQIYNTWFHKKYTQLSGKDFISISFKKNNSLCQSCFHKHVPFGSPKNNILIKTYSHMNIIITPRSTKTNFYNNYNSIEMTFDDNDYHTFINSKCYDNIEMNALNNKANYFGILHFNLDSYI